MTEPAVIAYLEKSKKMTLEALEKADKDRAECAEQKEMVRALCTKMDVYETAVVKLQKIIGEQKETIVKQGEVIAGQKQLIELLRKLDNKGT